VGISVVLRGEDRTDLGAVGAPYRPLVSWSQRGDFPMFGHVDPYGDTIFNAGQMQALLAELDAVEAAFPDAAEREGALISQIRELCNIGTRRPHSYLWFIGD
jgi:hypothetical protein